MQRDRIVEMLNNYREHAARCEYLEAQIPELERLAKNLRAHIVDDEISITQVISDMPRGTAISDPTGRLGMLLASGYIPDDIKKLEQEIQEKKDELKHKSITVVFVNAWLKGLTDRERFIVQKKAIDGAYWSELIYACENEYGIHYSKAGLRKMYAAAIDKICELAR
jgi:hypothetical protein